jgi:DNA-binding NtrC family response regulator
MPEGTPGPTLTLLFDSDSPYREQISDAVFLSRISKDGSDTKDPALFQALRKAITTQDAQLRVHEERWCGDDPSDHEALFEFLRDALPRLQDRFQGRKFIVHASPGTPSMQTLWLLLGETGFIQQPFEVVRTVEPWKRRRGRAAAEPVKLGFETFYRAYRESRPRQFTSPEQSLSWDPARFRSPKLRAVYDEARRFARLKVPVLLLGERGTGKTTLASWIRVNSPYRRKENDTAWPSVACGQYSAETMRAELFGHEKGAFTGALRKQVGLLATAHGDTLFLDEVGDISKDLQRLLIRALEEKQFLPLMAKVPVQSDFRLLTATNRPFEKLEKELDADFLDRISPLRLHLPALREIPEDLPWLWEYVFHAAAGRATTPVLELAREQHARIVEQLRRHSLPGNLRDLFQVAYRLLAALSDTERPMSPAASVDYSLEALEAPVPAPTEAFVRQVAAAFARGAPLDSLIGLDQPLPTKVVERSLKRYFAQELRRIAGAQKLPPQALCDVSERSLQIWAGQELELDQAKSSALATKESSTRSRKEPAK